ncbi:hypothetical protein LCGC14_1625480 [marine sediment metagenome]|uniref:NADP-dependent oxidoreductase domain-containing protein n=1 Tax=marine sediment metagenome TaxID=412755 RepID=A0A0F9I485_9ZZZZ
MIFSRLAIGTANWGREYNGTKVPEKDIEKILSYCQCSGIDTIHTSAAYGWDWSKVNSYFRVITKEKGCVSIYEPSEVPIALTNQTILQVPYSIYDRRFESMFSSWKGSEIHVRSIFLRGKLLEKFTPWECIAFCLMNPNVDRVIIGVDSYEQLKDDLRILHRMNSAEITDLDVIDPRRWKE